MKNYEVVVLETLTTDQWHDIDVLFITREEYQIIKEALEKILEARRDTE